MSGDKILPVNFAISAAARKAVELIFFITEQHHGEFEGKVLDYTDARKFFLRAR